MEDCHKELLELDVFSKRGSKPFLEDECSNRLGVDVAWQKGSKSQSRKVKLVLLRLERLDFQILSILLHAAHAIPFLVLKSFAELVM